MDKTLIARTLRVPRLDGPPGDGKAVARRLDAALLTAGFALSAELLDHLAGMKPGAVEHTGRLVLAALREHVGDHVRHNVYFKDFPDGVPDTWEFWTGLLVKALGEDPYHFFEVLEGDSPLNLLDLPDYGRYLHTYEQMVAAREPFIAHVTDRVTVVHLGADPDTELGMLYRDLAGSAVPLKPEDLALLSELAVRCLDAEQPAAIPVRENRAVIDKARLHNGRPLLAGTVTDVLRLACALSDGDVSLAEPTRFRSFTRGERKALLAALDGIVKADEARLADVLRHAERFKRLGERLHPHEYPKWPHAARVFAVARGEEKPTTLAAWVEMALGIGDTATAVEYLSTAPGMLMRALDHVVRTADEAAHPLVLDAVREAAPKTSGRVLLSLREHLGNRHKPAPARLFVNARGRAWATAVDERAPIARDLRYRLCGLLDAETAGRLPAHEWIVYDPEILRVALPLSDKGTADGFGTLPRGTRAQVDGQILRFFMYWKQREIETDYDLSLLLLDGGLGHVDHLSYTNLRGVGGAHSGDITSARKGASEFIDITAAKVPANVRYLVPQVNVYCGEGFGEVEESFFGYMTRTAKQKGRPFEARTVRTKSDLRGSGRVALPLVFERGKDGGWTAIWLNLFLRGNPAFNQVEGNRVSTSQLTRALLSRRYLTVGHLLELHMGLGTLVTPYDPADPPAEPVVYIGLERPEVLPAGSEVFTPDRFTALIPA